MTEHHKMVSEAKRLANRKFENIMANEFDGDGRLIKTYVLVSIAEQERRAYNYISRKHPKWNMEDFKLLVKRYRQENKEKEIKFLRRF